MDQEILKKLGFTQGEVKVYLSLLKLGNVTSGPIVDDSGISKSKVYEILERLTKKGIVSPITDEGVRHFQAVDPNRLLDIWNEKKEEIDDLKNKLTQFMPQLEAQFNATKEKQEVNILRGYRGLKSVFHNILNSLNEGDDYIIFCAVEIPDTFKPFIDDWEKERVKKKINQRIIFNENVLKSHVKKSIDYKYTQVKKIHPEFNTPAVFNLYKNKTAILLWSKNPLAILIENEEITDSFKKYFEVLWKISKK
jgi:sugar-specific transcriptional regulator TrmB